MNRTCARILLIVLILAACTMACVSGGGGGGGGSETATAYANEYVSGMATATFGAEQFHAQLTAQAAGE